ncbi:ABC transporter permease [Methanocella sp. CWC-04]|uniref:ABC transporter permease n=1 Tax=Methanooceanicella nereidis TaxID=2052831 RepID=A0AAP2RDI1_9EURY|nr:substrate-binding domain-containing protein [Methanocella sp. CWC-04]MCD1294040.1 ABC transporter permease [Methanocella sp. CWC-04]
MDSKKLIKLLILSITVLAVMVSISGCTTPEGTATPTATATPEPQTLRLATTTSTYDSGLLSVLLPPFEEANNVKIEILSKGSGEAMKLGEAGDVDVLMVHSPAAEKAFMDAGYGWNRTGFMHNDFVIIGPKDDPAGIKGDNATFAFTTLAEKKIEFISRGDNSGTNAKEKTIWSAAGITPDPKSGWYVETGLGMADTLRMAEEKQAYTLSDRSTYLAKQGNMTLAILVEGDSLLANPYSVIAVNQTLHPNAKYDLAKKFMDYVCGAEGQGIIKEYGKPKYGQPLFFPDIIK